LNRKIVKKIIQSDKEHFPLNRIQEAEDGDVAVDMVRAELLRGGHFDFILIDYTMVCVDSMMRNCINGFMSSYEGTHAWTGSGDSAS